MWQVFQQLGIHYVRSEVAFDLQEHLVAGVGQGADAQPRKIRALLNHHGGLGSGKAIFLIRIRTVAKFASGEVRSGLELFEKCQKFLHLFRLGRIGERLGQLPGAIGSIQPDL